MINVNDQILETDKTPEALRLREPFFANNVTLADHPVFCIDDRASEAGLYISAAGGLQTLVNIYSLMREVKEPGSVDSNFASDTASLARVTSERKLRFGVHSDDSNEGGKILNHHSENDALGCGFIVKLSDIQKLIYENSDELIDEVGRLAPNILMDAKNIDFARNVSEACRRLSGSTYFNTTPRDS
ncbi:MAG: hypothetical protein WDN66_03115 [Candidatus Saccharibacteria bacterium]